MQVRAVVYVPSLFSDDVGLCELRPHVFFTRGLALPLRNSTG